MLDIVTLQTVVLLAVFYKVGVPLVLGAYKCFLRPGKKLKKYGEWAVVTGATDGIGKALCVEFAKQGLNVFLISRTEAKLVEVEAELKTRFGGSRFGHLAVDFSGGFDAGKEAAVVAALDTLDVGVLANNVGMSYPFTKYYHELTDAEARDLLALNVESTFVMTKLALGDETKGMIARKRGAIVNTSSAAGTQISPLLAGYSGAKGGIVMFSKSLAAELKPKGIDVQVQTPLFVTTKLAKIKRASLTVPSPSTYAKAAVKAIGYDDAISPFWSHAIQLWLMDCLPTSFAVAIVANMHHAIRKKGLKKEAAKKEDKKAQ
ncbi:hypothetical protein CTAYLR_002869 [Chrysophaeum taylorii]|uniref:Uncharacterized protein n=1 Tax=Chrysophaeum taylorii TaxID=2483200 RepID=A0AAD7XL01_9STRA|nr:hypothetical protein CTAYLR_002869 [Chrysophaeum taylorii]